MQKAATELEFSSVYLILITAYLIGRSPDHDYGNWDKRSPGLMSVLFISI